MSAPLTPPVTAADSPRQGSQRRLRIFTVKDRDSEAADSTKNTYDLVIKDAPDKDTHLYLDVAPMVKDPDWRHEACEVNGASPICLDQSVIDGDVIYITPVAFTYQDPPATDVESRLKTMETRQTLLQQDFHQFKTDITTEIFSLKEINTRLMTLVTESSEKLQDSMDRLLLKFSENSDHLGQHILDVRRDIIAVAKRQQSATTPPNSTLMHVHAFEWEVTNIDSWLKNQKECSSHVYHIPHVDYKFRGSVVCHRDGRMLLSVAGEFGQNANRHSLPRNSKFECSASVLDKSDKLPEMYVGRVSGDFTRENAWFLGELSVNDVKKKGFVAKGGNIILKFTIEMSG